MSRSQVFLLFHLALVSVTPAFGTGDAASPNARPYTADYEVLRDGELVTNITLELSRQDDAWVFRGYTHDMHGLGKLLNVKGQQAVNGEWRDGWFQPSEYTFAFSLVGFRSRWSADFDWQAGTVTTGKNRHKISLPLDDYSMDPMTIMLNTGAMLSEGQSLLQINVIDEDEIETHRFEAHPGENLDTALGCVATTRVERLRDNPKRKSTAWYAEHHGYIPLQLHHIKKKGKSLKVNIISLEIDGQAIQSQGPCLN